MPQLELPLAKRFLCLFSLGVPQPFSTRNQRVIVNWKWTAVCFGIVLMHREPCRGGSRAPQPPLAVSPAQPHSVASSDVITSQLFSRPHKYLERFPNCLRVWNILCCLASGSHLCSGNQLTFKALGDPRLNQGSPKLLNFQKSTEELRNLTLSPLSGPALNKIFFSSKSAEDERLFPGGLPENHPELQRILQRLPAHCCVGKSSP